MADNHDRYESEGTGGFMMGLLTGTVLGAGLGMLLAPRAGAELRGQIGEQVKNIGNMASDQYRKASDMASDQYRKASETAGNWAERGREFMDRARDAVARGAEEGYEHGSGTSGSSYGSTSPGMSGSSGSPGSTGSTYGSTPGSTGTGGSFGKPGGDFGRS